MTADWDESRDERTRRTVFVHGLHTNSTTSEVARHVERACGLRPPRGEIEVQALQCSAFSRILAGGPDRTKATYRQLSHSSVEGVGSTATHRSLAVGVEEEHLTGHTPRSSYVEEESLTD